tara:strand:+ start:591 stop:692 length:102 start_codon:yes stop_codon:yes gene_type:complete
MYPKLKPAGTCLVRVGVRVRVRAGVRVGIMVRV